MRPIEKVLDRFPDARKSGKGWSAPCPAHEDRNPSLSIAEGDDGRALLKCHAGCKTEDVCRAKGLAMADLMPERQVNNHGGGFPSADAAIRAIERNYGPRSGQWDYRNDAGLHVGSVVRWDHADGKKIRPVARVDGQWKPEGMPSPRPLYRLPEVKAAGRVVITEGEKAAEAAVRLGYEASTSAHGSKSADKTDWSPLAGKDVVILPDNDEAGKAYAAQVAAILAELDPLPVVRIVELPDLPKGGDIADLVETAGDEGLDELRNRVDVMIAEAPLAARQEENPPRNDNGRPKIWLTKGERDRVTDQTLAILASDYFQRGGVLLGCFPSPTGKAIDVAKKQTVADTLNRDIDWARWKEDEDEANGGTEIREDAPGWLPDLIVEMQVRAYIRPLEGLRGGPFLRRDGSIGGIRPGYDEQSQYLIETNEDWSSLETSTTKSQVDEAIALLREVIAEFPFENDTSESVWIALILTRLARAAFDGPSPLFVLEASTPGSGKSMLARLAGVIADGKSPGTISFYANEEEMRKTITSMLLAGAAYLFFDNASGPIKSPTLDRILTSTTLIDRLLQFNKIVELPNSFVPLVTVNNASFGGDTLRRSLVLRLAPLQEKPEERTFRIANLDRYVLENRRSLLIAAMRILQWFVQCGRPQQPVCSMGSFEDWSALVRQAVIHAGLPDPWVADRAVDATISASGAFLIAWKAWDKNWSGSARKMVEAVFSDQSPAAKNLQDASLELVGSMGVKDGRPDAQTLGNYLGRIQGRNFADLRVMKAEQRSASGFVWRLEEVAQTAKK